MSAHLRSVGAGDVGSRGGPSHVHFYLVTTCGFRATGVRAGRLLTDRPEALTAGLSKNCNRWWSLLGGALGSSLDGREFCLFHIGVIICLNTLKVTFLIFYFNLTQVLNELGAF